MDDSPRTRPLAGLMIAMLGVAVLTAFAAWSPPSIRKLLLFSCAYGLCVGGVVIGAAKEFGLTRLSAVAVTCLLTITGLSLIAVRGLHQLQSEQAEAAKGDSDQAVARNIIESAATQDPALAAQLDAERRAAIASFADYLALRVKPLGEWRQPWPIIFWGGEALLSAACGTFLVSRQLRSPVRVTEEQT